MKKKISTVQAITLEKVKQAIKEIKQARKDLDGYDPQVICDSVIHVDEILDKLIESEEDE